VKLNLTEGSDDWKKMRKRSRDLFWFNSVVLGFANVFPLEEETHLVIHRFMERNTGNRDLDESPVQLLMWPRETGKSTCGTVGYAIWLAVHHPDIAILIANEVEETAKDFIKAIKWHFQANELLRALFPEVIPPDFAKVEWSATRATLQRSTGRPEATFDCVGVGGTKVGKHFDVIICDDLVTLKAAENARRASKNQAFAETNRWINQLQPMLSKAAEAKMGPGFPFIRFIGTRWYPGDSYEHIETAFGYDNEPKQYRLSAKLSQGDQAGKTVSRVVTRQGDLSIMRLAGRENGKPTFPKIWDDDRMQKLQWQDPELFACNIMNNPADAAVRTFQDDWLRHWRYTDSDKTQLAYTLDDGKVRHVKTDNLLKIAVTDPAFTANSAGSRAAIIVLGSDMTTGKHLVLDVSAARKDPKDNLEDFVNMIQNHGVRRAFVELAGQQLAYFQWIEQELHTRDIQCLLETVKPGGRQKDVRIQALQVPFKNGDVYVHSSHSDLLDEYQQWRPGAPTADVLDALAYAMEAAPKRQKAGRSAQERLRKQLNSYHQRRGMAPAPMFVN